MPLTEPVFIITSSLSPYTINSDDGFSVYLLNASGGNISITLPDITNNDGYSLRFVRIDNTPTNTISITGFNGQLIDELSLIVIPVVNWIILYTISGGWYGYLSTSGNPNLKRGSAFNNTGGTQTFTSANTWTKSALALTANKNSGMAISSDTFGLRYTAGLAITAKITVVASITLPTTNTAINYGMNTYQNTTSNMLQFVSQFTANTLTATNITVVNENVATLVTNDIIYPAFNNNTDTTSFTINYLNFIIEQI